MSKYNLAEDRKKTKENYKGTWDSVMAELQAAGNLPDGPTTPEAEETEVSTYFDEEDKGIDAISGILDEKEKEQQMEELERQYRALAESEKIINDIVPDMSEEDLKLEDELFGEGLKENRINSIKIDVSLNEAELRKRTVQAAAEKAGKIVRGENQKEYEEEVKTIDPEIAEARKNYKDAVVNEAEAETKVEAVREHENTLKETKIRLGLIAERQKLKALEHEKKVISILSGKSKKIMEERRATIAERDRQLGKLYNDYDKGIRDLEAERDIIKKQFAGKKMDVHTQSRLNNIEIKIEKLDTEYAMAVNKTIKEVDEKLAQDTAEKQKLAELINASRAVAYRLEKDIATREDWLRSNISDPLKSVPITERIEEAKKEKTVWTKEAIEAEIQMTNDARQQQRQRISHQVMEALEKGNDTVVIPSTDGSNSVYINVVDYMRTYDLRKELEQYNLIGMFSPEALIQIQPPIPEDMFPGINKEWKSIAPATDELGRVILTDDGRPMAKRDKEGNVVYKTELPIRPFSIEMGDGEMMHLDKEESLRYIESTGCAYRFIESSTSREQIEVWKVQYPQMEEGAIIPTTSRGKDYEVAVDKSNDGKGPISKDEKMKKTFQSISKGCKKVTGFVKGVRSELDKIESRQAAVLG